tara:strand:- start:104 stop:574 length:471 start_codon:yes stop_codon:yes gene_type:complete
MYLPTPATFPMLIGGAYRSWWEERRLKPVVESVRKEEGGPAAEKKSAQMLLLTFMIAAGALTGEAFYGVEAAILAVLDGLEVSGQALSLYSWWPFARLGGFVMINVMLGVLIYVLFSKAGIIGDGPGGEPSKPTKPRVAAKGSKKGTGVLDAELAD